MRIVSYNILVVEADQYGNPILIDCPFTSEADIEAVANVPGTGVATIDTGTVLLCQVVSK